MWQIDRKYPTVVVSNGEFVASTVTEEALSPAENKAAVGRAKLIALAPQMLEYCRAIAAGKPVDMVEVEHMLRRLK